MMLLWEMIAFVTLGMLAGTLSGLLGIGGGIIVVPGLVLCFKFLPFMPPAIQAHMAIGTSLAIMIVTASASTRAHYRLGHINSSLLKRLWPGVLIGVVAGALLSSHLQSHTLEIILGAVLMIIAIHFFIAHKTQYPHRLPGALTMGLFALLIGFKSGLLGLGGGALIIPFLLFCGISMRTASGTAAACTLPVAIVGTLSYWLLGSALHPAIQWSAGFIYWPAFLGVALASFCCVPLGATLSTRIDSDQLKRIFSVFLFFVALRLLL
jgi:uncharacterized protein